MINRATIKVSAIVSMILLGLFLVCLTWNKAGDMACKGVRIMIKDSVDYHFLSSRDVSMCLSRNQNPFGLMMKSIDLKQMETTLEKIPFVKEAQCYKTPSGQVAIELLQRRPIMRVKSGTDDYYVDTDGHFMPLSHDYAAHVLIVSGECAFSRMFVQKQLFDFVKYVVDDDFWNAQFEQLYVKRDGQIEIVPRVGSQIINLGKTDDYEKKLAKLMTLYKEGFSKVGWNKYSRIDLSYKGQVVCTRR